VAAPDKPLISLVVPAYNEEENVEPLYEAVREQMDLLANRYDFELVFTDNHSTDGTFDKLEALAARDARVRAYRFSRNFGFQRSILTGYFKARGAAVIQIDCDLQDPPALIAEFLRHWEQGVRVVYGVRRRRREGWLVNLARKAFYRLINWLSEDDLPLDAGDFRLVDRQVVEALRQFDDAQPYLRGTIATLGFHQVGIPYDRAGRQRGESKFPWRQMLALALDGILNHSIVPLRLATYTGLLVSLLTVLGSLGYVVGRLFFERDWPAGFATTTVLILMTLGLNALFLGIIGEYLGRIFRQVRRQPLTLIERAVGVEPNVKSGSEP
jgi:dolichol-phosphate mannosyltransferase